MARWSVRILGVLICMGIGAVLALVVAGGRSHSAPEHEGADAEKHDESRQRVSRDAEGRVVLTLDEETRQRMDLTVESLVAFTLAPEITGYGRIEEDPSRSFTLRAPVAGMLRASASTDWPRMGGLVEDGAAIGAIEPRLTAAERVDFAARLATARAEVDEADASLAASRASYENKKKLNADARIVSDRTMEEAEAKRKSDEAKLRAAQETAHLIEAAVTAGADTTGSLPLRVDRGGEVVELLARPGEAIESGQAILRTARFDRVAARVELPVGTRLEGGIRAARVVAVGHDDEPLHVEVVSLAPPASAGAHGPICLCPVGGARFPLRPGMPVTAYLQLAGAPQSGVSIPRGAVVRYAARAWVYVQSGEDKFTRREVALDRPVEQGWFAATGFAAGDQIVADGAQTLLSEELAAYGGHEAEGD